MQDDRQQSPSPPADVSPSVRADIRAAASGELGAVTAELSAILGRSGPLEVLTFLNARTRFRFTGVYRAEPPLLRNVTLFDRENPTLNVSGEVCPLEETYCAIACATGSPFATPDAPHDTRLRGHAARNSVLSYAGVPIRGDDGVVWGTLCHFDVRPRLVPSAEFPVLEAAARLLSRQLVPAARATS